MQYIFPKPTQSYVIKRFFSEKTEYICIRKVWLELG